jgi:hypothetical protein
MVPGGGGHNFIRCFGAWQCEVSEPLNQATDNWHTNFRFALSSGMILKVCDWLVPSTNITMDMVCSLSQTYTTFRQRDPLPLSCVTNSIKPVIIESTAASQPSGPDIRSTEYIEHNMFYITFTWIRKKKHCVCQTFLRKWKVSNTTCITQADWYDVNKHLSVYLKVV